MSSRSIRQMLATFFGDEFLRTASKLRKRKRKSLSCEFTSSTKREMRHFQVVVVQRRQRNVPKKRDARAKLLFC